MKYKLSRYNVIFNRESGCYLWNTFSGALIKLDEGALAFIERFDGQECSSPYYINLKENGCLVEENIDELGKVLVDEKTMTLENNPSTLYFTIAPGLGCNYNCEYCFENHRTSHKKMSLDIQDSIIQHIQALIENNKNLKKISITWFGGEPLLYVDIIYSLSKRVISMCDSKGIGYYSGMISNGRYLTPQNVQKLKECRIGHLQVSIDGMEENYTKVKRAKIIDFKKTISNIVYAANYLPLAIRINVFNSIEEAERLTQFLLRDNNLDGKIKIYIAHTREYDKNLSTKREQELYALFLKNELKYINLFGQGGLYKKESFEYRIPKRRGTSCLSACKANLCIGPEGELYQCEHHYGLPNKQIGTLANGFLYNRNFTDYLTFKHYQKCLRCKFFPVCLGGCIDDFVNKRNMLYCKGYRLRLIDLLMYKYEH